MITTAITTQDFSSKITDPARDTWTVGTLHYVMQAIGKTPVALVINRMTGCALVGVTLVRAYADADGCHRLTLSHEGYNTNYRVSDLGGFIMPMEPSQAKWDALNLFREAKRVAIARAREMNTQVREWGTWDARPITDSWHVEYTPSTGNAYYADRWGTRGSWQVPIFVTG